MKTASVSVNDFITLKPVGRNQHHKHSQSQRQTSQNDRLKQRDVSTFHQTLEMQLLSNQRQEAEPGSPRRGEEHEKHPDAHGKKYDHRKIGLRFLHGAASGFKQQIDPGGQKRAGEATKPEP